MVICITGAAGFIGSHLAEKLLNSGHKVIGIDNFDPFYPRSFKEYNLSGLSGSPDFELFEADIRDSIAIREIFRSQPIDLVIHLAAKAGVRPSIDHTAEYYSVNINGTLNLLESMKEEGISRMVFASSSSVYGNNRKVPFSEEDVVDFPISPYAATKKSGELLCHVYTHLHGFDITCLRFFTVFGPRQRPDLAIHKFTRMIDLGQPIPFFGDGSTARDYTYVDDTTDGIIGSIDHLKGFQLYNLGESRLIRLDELVKMIERSLNKTASVQRLPSQPGDVEVTYADISKARSMIGYNPHYDMETGIRKFTDWYLDARQALYSF